MKIEKLPSYVYCASPDCNERHYLSFNKDVDGKWCAAYVEYVDYMAVAPINSADTLQEAATRVYHSLKRHGLI